VSNRRGAEGVEAAAVHGAAATVLFRPRSPDSLLQEHCLELPLGYAPAEPAEAPRIAVVLHAFHLELVPEFRDYLRHIPFPADLFISTDTEAKRGAIAALFADWPAGAVEVRVVPNRGRDIAPKIVGFAEVHRRYDHVLHLHTKVSAHDAKLAGWRGYILEGLLGSPEVVRGVLEAFRVAPWLGMLAPQHIDMLRPWIGWGTNFAAAAPLARRLGIGLAEAAPLDFPSGSMFWARGAALRPLLDLGLRFEDFPEESGQTDGTLAHAIERLYFHICEAAGFGWMKVAARGALHDEGDVTGVTSPAELARFLSRRRLDLGAIRDQPWTPGNPALAFPYPSPRRMLHIGLRGVLGTGRAPSRIRTMGLLLPEPVASDLARSVACAVSALPEGLACQLLTGGADAVHRADPDLLVLVTEPGLLHPDSLVALAGMVEAGEGDALVEASRFPSLSRRAEVEDGFAVPELSGPMVAVPRALLRRMDGSWFGPDLLARLSAKARAEGLATRCCPRALFLSAPMAQDAPESSGSVDILLPFHDLAELPLLQRAVFALAGQALRPAGGGAALAVTVNLLLPRYSVAELAEVRAALRPFQGLVEGCRLVLLNWDHPEPHQLAAAMLNLGLDRSSGRYIACAGLTDLLLPGALARLAARLEASGAAIASGRLREEAVEWWGDVVLPRPVQPAGAAAGIVLLDRSRIRPSDLVVQVGRPGGELDEFLGRLQALYPADETLAAEVLGLRQVPR
jgi:hypothetical protein